MKPVERERTPEEIEKMTEENKKQYSKVAAVLWSLCTVAWAVLFVLDCVHDAAILQFVLHGFCMVCNGATAVIHIIRCRRMKREDTTPTQDTLDSEDK